MLEINITGNAKTGKSWIALQLAAMVMDQKRILFVCSENLNTGGNQEQLNARLAAIGVKFDHISFEKNCQFALMPPVTAYRHVGRLYVGLLKKEDFPYDLIFVDTVPLGLLGSWRSLLKRINKKHTCGLVLVHNSIGTKPVFTIEDPMLKFMEAVEDNDILREARDRGMARAD